MSMFYSTITFVMMILGASSSAIGQPWPDESFSFQLSIRVAKDGPYIVNEPVILNVELTNVGSVTHAVSPDLSGLTQSVMYYASSNGEDFRLITIGHVAEPSRRSVPVDPGASIYHDEVLLFDGPSSSAFPAPGRYHIRAKWHDGARSVEDVVSNTIQIDVEAPRGKDQPVAETVGTPEMLFQMMPEALSDKPEVLSEKRGRS